MRISTEDRLKLAVYIACLDMSYRLKNRDFEQIPTPINGVCGNINDIAQELFKLTPEQKNDTWEQILGFIPTWAHEDRQLSNIWPIPARFCGWEEHALSMRTSLVAHMTEQAGRSVRLSTEIPWAVAHRRIALWALRKLLVLATSAAHRVPDRLAGVCWNVYLIAPPGNHASANYTRIVTEIGTLWPLSRYPGQRAAYFVQENFDWVPYYGGEGQKWTGPALENRISLIRYCIKRLRDQCRRDGTL